MIEVAGVALEEGQGGEFGLLDVEIAGFAEPKEHAAVEGVGRVDDDDVFAFLEMSDQAVAIPSGADGDQGGDQEPEPGEPIAFGEEAGGIEVSARPRARGGTGRGGGAGGSFHAG